MGQLTEEDHNQMDRFIGRILDQYKNGKCEKISARGNLVHVIAALDKGQIDEFRSFIRLKNKDLDD